MSVEEAKIALADEGGEFFQLSGINDIHTYRKHKCVLDFDVKSGWLIRARYEVVNNLSESGPGAVQKE